MSESSPPEVFAPPSIPGQRLPSEHPMAPHPGPPHVPAVAVSVDEPYAHWWRRVVATLIDVLLVIPFWVVGVIGAWVGLAGTTIVNDGTGGLGSIRHVATTTDTWVGAGIVVAAYLSLMIFSIWNQIVRQGRVGASIGKACLHLMVVSAVDGRPIGVFATFLRSLAHFCDGLALDVGYLWPLVDRRRQTFADKIMNTVVLHLPPLPPDPPRPSFQAPFQAPF